MKVCHWIRGGRSEMPRFDGYLNSGVQAKETPYLLDVQSDLLQGLETRIVVPLRRRDRFPVVSLPANLMPAFEIEGVECLLETPKLAAVPLRLLKRRSHHLQLNTLKLRRHWIFCSRDTENVRMNPECTFKHDFYRSHAPALVVIHARS